ncbi:alpha/beta hydrolase [Nitrospina gracilis]|uniref:alpha/beta hydrolase n=1 Tax=Nitrospina gracilis TaxID=35801 RepID=UPI001F32A646|nr:alpha/beta fold hydrolase [Nitrospina gracilis]MCF8721165.1 esterase/lipase superfamily enzyme [Nitrospina gracilis Nb-211]
MKSKPLFKIACLLAIVPFWLACAQTGPWHTTKSPSSSAKVETSKPTTSTAKQKPDAVAAIEKKFPGDEAFEKKPPQQPAESFTEPKAEKPEHPTISAETPSFEEPQFEQPAIHTPSGTEEIGATMPLFEDTAKQQKGFVVANVFYGTTRKYTGIKTSPKFYGGEAGDELEYGVATISVPTDPKMRSKGSLTTPLTIFEVQLEEEDPKKHVILKNAGRLSKEVFLERLNGNLANHPAMLVFVHGFNNTFEYAVQRAAQLAYDLEFDGTSVVFSWPSNGQAQDYIKDANRIRAAAIDLRQFLKTLHKGTQAKSVYLVAHSMGSVALTNALHDLALEMKEQEGPIFDEVILAAPDIDQIEFQKLFAEFKRITARTTLYASSRDQALIISREVNGYRRAGDSTGGILTLPGLDSIDVSRLDTNLIGHSYFGDNKSVISDIYRLIRGSPIYQRGKLVKRTLKGLTFWEFIP